MRDKMDLEPVQAAGGRKPTISEVFAEYLRAEKSRLAPKTHARYSEVIALFTQSLNGYAANSLSRFERARFDKHFNAEGEEHGSCPIGRLRHSPAHSQAAHSGRVGAVLPSRLHHSPPSR
jgi:hypothetical protein